MSDADDLHPPELVPVERYLLAYMDAWNEADVGAVTSAYHTPCFILKAGQLVLHLDRSDKERYFGELVDATRAALAAGARWECPSLRTEPVGESTVLVTVRWVFERLDGYVLEDYLDTYLLTRMDGTWRFVGDIVHENVEASPVGS